MSEKETVKEGLTDENTPPAFFRRWGILLFLVLFLAFGIYSVLGRFGEAQERKASSPAIPVAAVPAKKSDFNVYIVGLGTVTPTNTVTLRTRVDGQLMEVLFEEGQTVKSGDLMATIDPRPFEVQLLQAEGQMARDQAQLKDAQVDLERYKVLWSQDSIAKQQVDSQEALVRQLEGAIKTDEAQIQSAKLQLIYSRITAPISGRVGLRLVDPGNIVHATDVNGLAVINQLQPITVIFSIPEDSLPPVLAALKAGKRLPVEAFNREQTKKLATGSLLTVDNQIDPNTGTVRLKATFENKDDALFPNQFVNARLLIDVIKDAIIAPSVAIQRGPQGPYIYVVNPDRSVTIHPITIRDIQGSDVSVSSGLSEGDLVVVDGAERLREGIKVELMGQGHNSGTGSSLLISPVSSSCGPWQPPCSWPPSFWPSRFWAVGAAISETLFEGGLRKAQTEQARAAYEATVASYRQTVLTGFQEVEDNLAALRILGQEAAVQEEAVKAAQGSVVVTMNQYKAGIIAYLNVIVTQAAALNNKRVAVSIQGQRMTAAVLLIKALGGGWSASDLPSNDALVNRP